MNAEKKENVHKNLTLIILRWTARIWSYIVVTFIVLFVGASLFESGVGSMSSGEAIAFAFFPIGLTIGLIIAWWKEGLGGIIATGSIIAFHLIMLIVNSKPDFVLFIELLAIPGPLFIIYWLLSRKKKQ
ncbi:MAG: hypothetical protein P9M11_11850 [Candidatus Tenebribacter burtonii]|nr:hypothetical protein [Candidatus Tenebribacter burtonii]